MSPNKSYAGEVLKEMHGAFVKTYGTDYLDDGSMNSSVSLPLSVLGIPESCVWALSRLI
ncbi:MAG: hypothetical protein ACLR23_14530 [Clostridia bacterium]